MSLTEAQRAVLQSMASGQVLVHSGLSGNVWRFDGGFTIKVRNSTFNALALRNLIVASDVAKSDTRYRITPAGRSALQKDDQPS